MLTATHRLPGLVLREREFTVPLDHQAPAGETITVFGREVADPDRDRENLPWLVFFQGGPGFGAPRPLDASGWLGRDLRTVLPRTRRTKRGEARPPLTSSVVLTLRLQL